MGGLVVTPNEPAPKYEFEMLSKVNSEGDDEKTLFLHFNVSLTKLHTEVPASVCVARFVLG